MEEPVTIVDRDVLKVLSVDTRIDILKELSQGSRTPSDLGKHLRKSDSTIIEHLEVLTKAGLVKKVVQPGKKWVFYTLTEKGQGVIDSKSRRLVIILATSFISFVGGIVSLNIHSGQNFITPLATRAPAEAVGISQALPATPIYLYLSVALFIVGIAGLSFYFIQKQKLKV